MKDNRYVNWIIAIILKCILISKHHAVYFIYTIFCQLHFNKDERKIDDKKEDNAISRSRFEKHITKSWSHGK